MRLIPSAVVAVASVVAAGLVPAAEANLLHSNGPFITSPDGGTGAIAGLPLSRAETFTVPGSTFNTATTGVSAGHLIGAKAADNFTVPEGGWTIESITLYGFQTYASNATTYGQTVTRIYLNLWDTTPYTAESPDLPPGTPIPQPLLSAPLEFDVTGQGTLAAHRVSGSSTSTVRPVYAWTLPAGGLPNSGQLDPGTYWLEFSMEGVGPQTNNVFVPLVTPRDSVSDHNARLYNRPFAGSPFSWFEGREGYQSEAQPGRAYSLPFEIRGIPEPTGIGALAIAGAALLVRRRRA